MNLQDLIEQMLSYIRGIWRYRWYSLGVAWMLCIVGWFAIYQLPDEYEASAQVYVDTESVLGPLLQGIAIDVNNPDQQVALMTRTLLSRPNLEKVIRQTDLDLRAQDQQALDELISNLRADVRLQGSDKQNLYTLTYTDENPRLAKGVVQALLNVFVENTLDGDREVLSDTAQRFLEREINLYEQRMLEAEQRMTEFKRNNVGLLPSDGKSYYQQMVAVRQALQVAELELQQSISRRDAINAQLLGEEPSFGLEPATSPANDNLSQTIAPVVDLPIQNRIAQLEQSLDNLMVRYTERHPDVVTTKKMLEELKVQRDQQIKQLLAAKEEIPRRNTISNSPTIGSGAVDRNPVFQELKVALTSEEANVAAFQVRVNDLKGKLEELERQVDTIPLIEAQLISMNRDYQILRDRFQDLVERRESARISRNANQTAEEIRFQVIEPPHVPPDPSGPNRPVLMSGVLMAGLGLAVGLGFAFSQLFPTFDTRRSLYKSTNIPVLGSVGLKLSPATVRRQRLMVLVYLLMGGALFAFYAGLVVLESMGVDFSYAIERLINKVLAL